jgi:hypothetical protein
MAARTKLAPTVELTVESMRRCILEAMIPRLRSDYETLKTATAAVAQRQGFEVEERRHLEPTLLHSDLRRYRETIWGLIIEGIIVQGFDDANATWPFLGLSEYGEECVRAGEVVPHDPEGYLRHLATARQLDGVERRFVSQALEAFRRNLPDASAMMLGAASEHLLLGLAEAIAKKDAANRSKAKNKMDRPALTLLRFLQDYLSERKDLLPRALRENLDTIFSGIASLIRATRNDAGHPSLQAPVTRDQAFTNLQLYPIYRGWLIDVTKRLPLRRGKRSAT